jgi:5-carboxymethyl-2-hydroxymuconate isomerase
MTCERSKTNQLKHPPMKKTVSLPRLSVVSLVSYGDELASVLEKHIEAPLLDNDRHHTFTEAKAIYQKGYMTSRRSNVDLKKADANRDMAFLHLKHLVLAGCYAADEEVRVLAEKIKRLIERFGISLNKKRYIIESGSLIGLIINIQKPEYEQEVASLNLQTAIRSLEVAQIAFENEDLNKVKEKTDLKEILPPTRSRKAYEYAIRGLCEYIEAQVIVEPNSSWSTVKRHVERINGQYTAQLKRSKTFRNKRKAKNQKAV